MTEAERIRYFGNLGIKGLTTEKIHNRDVDRYELAEDEVLSEDGKAILCKTCGGVRAVMKWMEFFGCWRWEVHECECRLLEKWELNAQNDRKRWPEIVKSTYDDPEYIKECIGTALKDIRWDEPLFTENQCDSFINAKNALKRFCLQYDDLTEKKCGWYLYSPTRGNGKTTLSGMVRNELLHMGIPCVVVTMERLSSLKINSPALYYKMATTRCLIIDDIGVNPYNDWKNQCLYELLSCRASDDGAENGKYITCFTSNYGINELEKQGVSTACISRVHGASGAVIRLDAPTRRGR